jgi:hypothetical protein
MVLFFSLMVGKLRHGKPWREKRLESGDGTNSNKCTGPRKLQSQKRFLNIDARPIASFASFPVALCFFLYLAHCGLGHKRLLHVLLEGSDF